MIGPSLSGLILYAHKNNYYSIFYITAIICVVVAIFSFILCGKQQQLQSMQMSVKCNDDEYTKLNSRNNGNGNSNVNGNNNEHLNGKITQTDTEYILDSTKMSFPLII